MPPNERLTYTGKIEGRNVRLNLPRFKMTEEELSELTEPYFRHVENCTKCQADAKGFRACEKAQKLTEEIGRKAELSLNR